jgi:hypothetical protein
MASQLFKKLTIFVVIGLLTAVAISGCGASKATTGPFQEVAQLENTLKRGVSTKVDVEQLLGKPNGHGHSYLHVAPGQKQKPHEVWYYEDIEAINMQSPERNVFVVDTRQQIILIFFDQEKYDGFMWYTNAGKGSAYGE